MDKLTNRQSTGEDGLMTHCKVCLLGIFGDQVRVWVSGLLGERTVAEPTPEGLAYRIVPERVITGLVHIACAQLLHTITFVGPTSVGGDRRARNMANRQKKKW